jgi:triosephosphate isomerase (TIM)
MKQLIIANWKMEKSYNEAVAWTEAAVPELVNVLNHRPVQLVLCPSFDALAAIGKLLGSATPQDILALGAQDCSAHERGAYTGQVAARSLKEVGCTYGIVGHSERRKYQGETSALVAQKAAALLQHGITPIICVGEPGQEHADGKTLEVLQQQLAPVVEALTASTYLPSQMMISIAYEPVWIIGTSKYIDTPELRAVCQWLTAYLKHCLPLPCRLLYGGNINKQTVSSYRAIAELSGYLIGRASLVKDELIELIKELTS